MGGHSEPLNISVNRQVRRDWSLGLPLSRPQVEGWVQTIRLRQQRSALAARCKQQRALGPRPEVLTRLLLVRPEQWDLDELTGSPGCEPRPGDFAQGCTFTHTSGCDSLPGPCWALCSLLAPPPHAPVHAPRSPVPSPPREGFGKDWKGGWWHGGKETSDPARTGAHTAGGGKMMVTSPS